MSLSTEWKKEIENMSPHPTTNAKDKLIHIKDKRKSSSSRIRYKRTPKHPSCFQALYRWLSTQPYAAYIIVFLLFYLLGWFVVFSLLEEAEHDSIHRASSSLLHPSGDITHHLPRQIQDQISKLAQLQSLHEAKDKLSNIIDRAGGTLKTLQNGLNHNTKQRLNVAVNILITRDPGIEGGFLDSAGALVMSIKEANTKHNMTLIALVHKDVKYCLPILEAMGYQIRAYDTPFQIEDVRNKKIGEEMKTDGCCGILESLKLWAWTWSEFDTVLSVDADVHFHKNFDELFELNTTLGWTHGATAHMNQELMNGGYLIIKPNKKHFDDMVELLKEGDFRDGSAWKGSGVGWVYGGRTIQGIVPYYYLKVAVGDETEFARCKYNNMVEINKCRNWTYDMVTSNHFTWCQKPWYCITKQGQPLCDRFRERWWKRSHRFELEVLGFKEERPECTRKPYAFLQYYESPYMLQYFEEHGYSTEKPELSDDFLQKLKKKHG